MYSQCQWLLLVCLESLTPRLRIGTRVVSDLVSSPVDSVNFKIRKSNGMAAESNESWLLL